MKKKLLFVIPSLDAGGAEKSLVNLLNVIGPQQYEVDLFLVTRRGLFLPQVPSFVNVLPLTENLHVFQQPLLTSVIMFLKKGMVSLAWSRMMFALINHAEKNVNQAEQKAWIYYRDAMEELTGYDAAIGFLEKSSIYFVADKVKSKRKLAFIHTYYSALNANLHFDEKYFQRLDFIVTVSDECAEDLKRSFPAYLPKIKTLKNIISPELLKKLARARSESLPPNSVISIGRLVALKGFDLAVEAARILRQNGATFQWYIIGEGEERPQLESMIKQYDLQDYVHLLGLIENPYPYIHEAKVFVQPSRYEGKSIAVDEAKILAKPIVLTNFTTAKDQINNNFNGIICEMSPEALAASIQKYFDDHQFTEKIIANLKAKDYGTEAEINQFYELINA